MTAGSIASVNVRILFSKNAAIFELCRRTQQPSLKFRLVGAWQHVWLVAIVPPERWGKMYINNCHTAWGNFKTLIYSLHHYKNNACFFFINHKKKNVTYSIPAHLCSPLTLKAKKVQLKNWDTFFCSKSRQSVFQISVSNV
jgi:hypothetical protein